MSLHIWSDSYDSSYLEAAARLHCECLPDTLNSARGPQTLFGTYRYLARRGHKIYLAVEKDQVVGGLVVLMRNIHYSTVALLLHRPGSWIQALRQLGGFVLAQKFVDTVRVRHQGRFLQNHDYIIAMYVHESKRRRGVARELLKTAMNDSAARGFGLAVDTTTSNLAARELYSSLGFGEVGQTSSSIILARNQE
jgi:ribosomal protein S18 acetylase RimI-like enzyme